MGWWFYTWRERVIIIMGLVAIVLLVIVLVSPYVKPLQLITNTLGLVRIVYVPVYVNHTVYVNRTIYMNQTIYINRTVMGLPIINLTPLFLITPPNQTSTPSQGIPNPLNVGTCHIYSLVFNNGTVWTLGYWIPSNEILSTLITNTTLKWNAYNGTNGMLLVTTYPFIVLKYPGSGFTWLPMIMPVPGNETPGWVYIVYMGDITGQGQFMRINITSSGIVLQPIGPRSIEIPLNSTTQVILAQTMTGLVLPCNWTVTGPVSPGVALNLSAPMGGLFLNEISYILTGSFNNTIPATWGYIVWRFNTITEKQQG